MSDVTPEGEHTMAVIEPSSDDLRKPNEDAGQPLPCPVCHGEERSYHEIDELEGKVERKETEIAELRESLARETEVSTRLREAVLDIALTPHEFGHDGRRARADAILRPGDVDG